MEPLSDRVSPAPGMDIKGSTAALRSITKLNYCSLSLGTLVNLWVSGDSLNDTGGKRRFADLITTYQPQG
jgi:pyruvate-formate lyase